MRRRSRSARVRQQVLLPDVAEDRCSSSRQNGLNGGNIGQGWYDDLVAGFEFQRPDSEMQRRCAIADGGNVPHAEGLAETLFKFFGQGAHPEPAALEYLV